MRDIVKSDQSQDEVKIINGEEVVVSRKKRRRNMSLYYVLIVIFVALAMIFLSFTYFFRIKTITVSGNTLYTTEQVIEQSGVNIDDNLFRTNTTTVENRISSAFPYFESVEVTRALASTIEITVVEATPAVSIKYNDNEFMVVSTKGRILETGLSSPKDGTAAVYGMTMTETNQGSDYEDEDSIKKTVLDEIISEREKLGLDKITTIGLSERTDIRIIYNDTIKIKLGSSQDIPFKLSYIKSVIDKVGEDYSGTLIYHNADSGVSAIPDTAAEEETEIEETTEATTEQEDLDDYVE
ncbi:MAG: FtsQ-type POTRA domain-containing protein [Ruminococcus sp.]|nr:FtsQ-type POTRA domain-containing protein [Ruminococcus sp.]